MLLIDADPQGSLTASLGYEEPDDLRITLATIMMDVINEEEISLEAPSPSTHSRLIGSVPTEEELEKANIIAGSMPLKNFSGLNPPMALTAREYTTATWIT